MNLDKVLTFLFSFDLIWTLPWPYDKVTDIRSEDCPGLDVDDSPGLVAQHY